MNRLTERLPNGVVRAPVTDENRGDSCMMRLAAYEDTGLTPEEVAHAKDLLAAEKDGRCVVLPVGKIGDIVEWDSGVCKELFLIRGIVIYCDGTRYDLGEFMPVVTDEHICCIIPRAEAEKVLGKEAQS